MKENSLSKNIGKNAKQPTPVVFVDNDEQKKKNFELIGKMFGNMTQSINVNGNQKGFVKSGVFNSSLINNSSNNKFPGGFKQPIKSTLQQKDNNLSSSKPDIFTVYDQFGLINQSVSKPKSKPKYRPQQPNDNYNHQSNSSFQQPSSINEMKLNRREQFQKVMQNNYVNLHEYYDLAKEKGREQTVVHVKSSLDNMTLDNVEAKLQAHRRELKKIQSEYKQKKGIIQGDQVDEGKPSPVKNNYLSKFQNRSSQKQIPQSQVYSIIKKAQQLQSSSQNQQQLDELWQQKLQQNPKIAEYSKKYEQYLVQKDAKNIMYSTVRQNLFKWDKYTKPADKRNTNKSKQALKKLSKSREKSIGNKSLESFAQNNVPNLQASSVSNQSNISEVLASKDDKFIAKYIFTQVDVDKKGLLSKEELLQYITKNEHIIRSYQIDLKWLFTDLDNFQTKRKGLFNREELSLFLATFQHNSHPQIKLTPVSQLSNSVNTSSLQSTSSTPFQIYFAKDLYRFRNLFQKLDINEDKILKRQQFIEHIFIDPDCSQIIDKVVIKIKVIDKDISYRQVIGYVLDDYRNERNEKLKKAKQYITFSRFCQYFELPQSINLRSLTNKRKSKVLTSNEIQMFDLEEEHIQTLKDLFDTLPRVYQDFIVTKDFIQSAIMDPLVLGFQEELCRIQSVQTGLPIETVRLVLLRIGKEADDYVDWEGVKGFFSRRGRPLDWDQKLIQSKKKVRQQQRANSINQTLKRQLIMKNQLQISAKLKSQYQSQQKQKSQTNFTIPQPFKLTEKSKPKPKPNNTGESSFKQLSKQFKAKPVNKQIFEPLPEPVEVSRPQPVVATGTFYEKYENDKIERVLRKAQEQHLLKQKEKQIREMAKIKANKVGVDLTKKLTEVMKEKEKVIKDNRPQKQKPTKQQEQIIQRLHPKDGAQKDKIKKVAQKIKKSEEEKKAQEQKKRNQNLQIQQKIKKDRQKLEEEKKQKLRKQKQLQQEFKSIQQTYKPTLNPKKPLTQQERDLMEKAKQKRLQDQKQAQQRYIQEQNRRRKKILERQSKDPYIKLQELDGTEKIIQNIYKINLLDLLIDNNDRNQFNQDHDFQNKDRKQREIYLKGMANKWKFLLQKEDKLLAQMKIKKTQQVQKKLIAPKEISFISQRGKSQKMQNDITPYTSKSLLRYRKLMAGIPVEEIPSQYDRFVQKQYNQPQKKPYNRSDNRKNKKQQDILQDEEDQA